MQQAANIWHTTAATIPAFEAGLRQSQNALAVLMGVPPYDMTAELGDDRPIPTAPREVVVGIPAELLSRRPDVRRAEREVAAQSARIGIAASDFTPPYPSWVRSVGTRKMLVIYSPPSRSAATWGRRSAGTS